MTLQSFNKGLIPALYLIICLVECHQQCEVCNWSSMWVVQIAV